MATNFGHSTDRASQQANSVEIRYANTPTQLHSPVPPERKRVKRMSTRKRNNIKVGVVRIEFRLAYQ